MRAMGESHAVSGASTRDAGEHRGSHAEAFVEARGDSGRGKRSQSGNHEEGADMSGGKAQLARSEQHHDGDERMAEYLPDRYRPDKRAQRVVVPHDPQPF